METFSKKNSLQNLTRFPVEFFDLEFLGIFTTAFLLKTIWTFLTYSALEYFEKLALKKPKKLRNFKRLYLKS